MNTVKIGQVWKDKDKRRDRTVEILSIGDNEVHALVVGTEDETSLKIERLTKRWSMVKDAPIDLGTQLNEKLTELGNEIKTSKAKYKTREQWLEAAVKSLSETVLKDYDVPTVRVSVGWPGGRGPKANVVGQCWKMETATDKVSQIFISPVVDGPVDALAVLTHELVHAMDNGESGHRGFFARTSKEIGYEAPFKGVNVSETLREKFVEIADDLGEYPHAAILPSERPKVQKTYMVKVVPSPECHDCDPEYKLRMTEKWLDEAGAPLCPHGIEMEAE